MGQRKLPESLDQVCLVHLCYLWHLAQCLVHSMCVCMLSQFSHVWLYETLWTRACQAPLSMEFSRQEYWSGLSCPSPGDLPDPGIEPVVLRSPALAGRFFTATGFFTSHLGSPMYVLNICLLRSSWVDGLPQEEDIDIASIGLVSTL